MRVHLPLLLLLGVVFLASVSVSLQEKPGRHECLQSCESLKDPHRKQTCQIRCKHTPEREEQQQQEEREHSRPERGHRERGHQEGEKAEKEPEEHPLPRPLRPHQRDQEEEEEEWRGQHRGEDPEERERVRQREEKIRERRQEDQREWQKEQELQLREKKEQHQEREQDEGSESESRRQNNNPFHFSSNRFRTLYKNQYGHIRILERLDQRSRQLQNLRDYSVLEYKSKPNTLLLPHHADADFLLVVLSGKAVITLVNPDDRVSYNLESGDALRIRAGTTLYTLNPDNKENLRLIKLVMPVNKPAKLENFFLSSTQDQQSYLQGFSKNILEASFDTEYEEIDRILFGEEEQKKGEQSQEEEEGVIVEVSKEQIQELSRRTKSSSRKTISSEDEPFNLRSREPIYSNKFGKFFEVTPEKNPQLQDLDILLSSVDMYEGALLLPHFNSKAIVILVVNEGEAKIELVGLKEQQQKQQEEETREVRRYRAELCEDHIFVIPAGYPVSVNATSNLNFLAFGINAENNQRNFLAGEKDNVISNIQRQVKELAFPGSAEEVEKLIKKQRESYFVDAQPDRPKEQGRKGRRDPLSSIFF